MPKTSIIDDRAVREYISRYLTARKWTVYEQFETSMILCIWAWKRIRFRKVEIRIEFERFGDGVYLSKFQIDTDLPVLSPMFVLAQFGKALKGSDHPKWCLENGISFKKLLENYDSMAKDMRHPQLFR